MIRIVTGGEDAGLDSPGRANEDGMEMRRMLFQRSRNGQRWHEVTPSAAAGEENGPAERRYSGR